MKLRVRPVALRLAPAALPMGAALAAVLSILTGCGEVDAESPGAAFPVGVSVPRSNEMAPASSPTYGAEDELQPASAPAAPSERGPEVALGVDSNEPTAPQNEPAAQQAQQEDARDSADPAGTEADDTDPAALTRFRAALDPYGSWADDPTYGSVWVPSQSAVGADFTPYASAGHWAYNDDYVWVSDYAWGWAPFHYGRWVYANGPGWEWIPGRRYAGAWVSWRYGMDDWGYVGWAPLPPTWCWRRGVAMGIGFVPAAPYAFVSTGDLFARGIRGRVIGGDRVGPIAEHTRPWMPAATGGAGRVLAQPVVGGPPPATLRIPQAAVARLDARPAAMKGQGRVFGRGGAFSPTVAAPGYVSTEGARSERPLAAGFVANPAPAPTRALGSYSALGASAPGFSRSPQGSLPSRYAPQPIEPNRAPHFGGRMGTGFVGSAAVAGPSMGAAAPAYARPYYGASPQYAAPGAAHGGFVASPQYAASSAAHGGFVAGPPAVRAPGPGVAGSFAPAFSPPTAAGSASAFHGGGGFSGALHGVGGGSSGGGGAFRGGLRGGHR